MVSGSSEECPVLAAWALMQPVMRRAAEGKLCIIGGAITRQTVADNVEVIEPLLQHLGSSAKDRENTHDKSGTFHPCPRPGTRPSLATLEDLCSRFLYLARPRGKPLPTRDSPLQNMSSCNLSAGLWHNYLQLGLQIP